MKIVLLIIIIIILLLFIPREPFTIIQDSMVKNKLFDIAYDLGNSYLNKMKKLEYFKMEYPAVMFDIDDTLIDYSGKPIKPIIKLLNKCINDGVLVIIITARIDVYYNDTVKQLAENNIGYGALFLRQSSDDINTFKSKIKELLSKNNNINTIMSIGDNIIDINGDFSGYWIKLPNRQDPNIYHLNERGLSEQIIP